MCVCVCHECVFEGDLRKFSARSLLICRSRCCSICPSHLDGQRKRGYSGGRRGRSSVYLHRCVMEGVGFLSAMQLKYSHAAAHLSSLPRPPPTRHLAIEDGVMEVHMKRRGAEALADVLPGQVVGEMAIIYNCRRTATIFGE